MIRLYPDPFWWHNLKEQIIYCAHWAMVPYFIFWWMPKEIWPIRKKSLWAPNRQCYENSKLDQQPTYLLARIDQQWFTLQLKNWYFLMLISEKSNTCAHLMLKHTQTGENEKKVCLKNIELVHHKYWLFLNISTIIHSLHNLPKSIHFSLVLHWPLIAQLPLEPLMKYKNFIFVPYL